MHQNLPGFMLHQDNKARSHMVSVSMASLQKQNINVIGVKSRITKLQCQNPMLKMLTKSQSCVATICIDDKL
jgi:hypothetical protein